MTICAATLGHDSNAIVTIADKALSYGDHIQWDSDTSKIFKLNRDCLVMFSGAESEGTRILAGLTEKSDAIGGDSVSNTAKVCEEVYKSALNELIEAKILAPRFLDKDSYLASITSKDLNKYMLAVAKEVDKFQFNCDLLVCGFDDERKPFILSVDNPGVATNMTQTGFHAIGSGWDKAVSRLLFSEHQRKHELPRTLYDLFDAKAYAELAVGVGYEWDAVVLVGNPIGHCDISTEIKELVERSWSKFNRSPFEKYDRKKDLPLPPKDWKARLKRLIDSQVVSEFEKLKSKKPELEGGQADDD